MRVLAFPKRSDRNPYTSLLYGAVERAGVEVIEFELARCDGASADLLHVHWPDWFLARRNPLVVYGAYRAWVQCLRSLKARGAKIVWTAHNATPHERRHAWIQHRFWEQFDAMVDGCLCLSEASVPILRAAHPGLRCPVAVVPHGHYRDAYPCTIGRDEARRKLGLPSDAFVFVHIGMVRPYKNVPMLVRAFQPLQEDARLVVAGEVFDDSLRARIGAEPKNARTIVHLERVEDNDLQTYFRAADLAVFPYRDILNSGSALMALSFDVAVVVPEIGSMPELRAMIGPEWVMTYQGDVTAQVLTDAMRWATTAPRTARAPLDGLDWDLLAKRTVEFYSNVLKG